MIKVRRSRGLCCGPGGWGVVGGGRGVVGGRWAIVGGGWGVVAVVTAGCNAAGFGFAQLKSVILVYFT